MLISLFFAVVVALICHFYIRNPIARMVIGFITGLVVSVFGGITIGLLVESGGDVALGKSFALAGFKNSLATAVASLVLIAIGQFAIKRPAEDD